MSLTLEQYKALLARLHDARAENVTLRTRFEESVAHVDALALEVAGAEATIEHALAVYQTAPVPTAAAGDFMGDLFPELDVEPTRSQSPDRPPSPDGIRPSFYELMVLIPRGGETSIDDLKPHFKIADASLLARVGKIKKAGLIESAGRGRYRLTEKGRSLMGPHLKVVND